jgi:hypothetical protein
VDTVPRVRERLGDDREQLLVTAWRDVVPLVSAFPARRGAVDVGRDHRLERLDVGSEVRDRVRIACTLGAAHQERIDVTVAAQEQERLEVLAAPIYVRADVPQERRERLRIVPKVEQRPALAVVIVRARVDNDAVVVADRVRLHRCLEAPLVARPCPEQDDGIEQRVVVEPAARHLDGSEVALVVLDEVALVEGCASPLRPRRRRPLSSLRPAPSGAGRIPATDGPTRGSLRTWPR